MSETWTIAALEDLSRDALIRSGTGEKIAASVARALVAAEIDGQYGHGLRRLETYCPQVKSGKVDGYAVPALEKTSTAAARIDAKAGFAYPALDLAIDWLAETTPVTGIAAAGVFHSHHCGVAGHWTEKLAEKGLAAMMFANTPSAIPPAGGNAPIFGTNPIAFAAPRVNNQSLVIDLSLSKVARGKIMAAKQKGETIPEGWALDKDGKATTDATAALTGSMLPMGNTKGAALAMMVEILAAGLTAANFSGQSSSFLDAEGDRPGTGQLLIALAPHAFGGPGFTARLEWLCNTVLAQPGVRLPGSARVERREKARQFGVSVNPSLVALICNL